MGLVSTQEKEVTRHMLPEWLKRPAPGERTLAGIERMLKGLRLSTVCQSAHCPNLGECFNRGTATFMILGDQCTRNCRFCAVPHTKSPPAVDLDEPLHLADATRQLGLTHVVVTSVTRDDLMDGGAGQFIRTLSALRKNRPSPSIEILVPDFKGDTALIQRVCNAKPDVFNHNLETVPRLYPAIRPQAEYERSLSVIKLAAQNGLTVKSGLMLGLGETIEEGLAVFKDLVEAGCTILTLGQYLSPSDDHAPVVRYLPPEEFDLWAEKARDIGFREVFSGPFVRSSYRAEEVYQHET
jgi:lipoyl synthase